VSVLYSFGAFDMRTRASSLYDPASDKYSAFYGAYVVQEDGGVFGFNEDGSLNADEVAEAVRYDDTQLVLANFGCDDPVFEIRHIQTAPGAACAGSNGWTRVDAVICSMEGRRSERMRILPKRTWRAGCTPSIFRSMAAR
jgi:hypothetical protein